MTTVTVATTETSTALAVTAVNPRSYSVGAASETNTAGFARVPASVTGATETNTAYPVAAGAGLNILDSAVVTDSYVGARIIDLSETAVVTGDAVPPLGIATDVLETAVVTSPHDTSRVARLTVRDGLEAHDGYLATRVDSFDVSETAVVTDTATLGTQRYDVLESAVVVGDGQFSLASSLVVRESATALGYATTSGAVDIRDTAVVTSYETDPHVRVRLDVSETSVITGVHNLGAGDYTTDVREVAVLSDTLYARLDARLDINEEAFFSDTLTSTGGTVGQDGYPVGTVWTCSVYSWGMSRHTSGALTQRGVRYAVSPDGLFEVGATYSNATLETGRMDMGTKKMKRVAAVYLQGERDGDMSTTVTADSRGREVEHAYAPLDRLHDDARSIRTDIGMGYYSTYYKLKVETAGRAELFGGKLLKATSGRRI